MIRINNIKLPYNHKEEDLINTLKKDFKIKKEDIISYEINKKSIDARQKQKMIYFVYSIDLKLKNEDKYLKIKHAQKIKEKGYEPPTKGDKVLASNPVIVGSGPAGLFAGLILAEEGYKPIIIEQGEPVNKRVEDINHFWNNGELKPHSNIQFGEGGAGTFSDGKLTTLIKDKAGRIQKVFDEFVENGAPEEIKYIKKPHIGTDILRIVVFNIRKKIESLGGNFLFNSKLTDINIKNNIISSIKINENETIRTDILILATGHSARETFELLLKRNINLEQKPFSMGVRIEHPQELINKNQYGNFYKDEILPQAEYKLSEKNGYRGIYTFCMCPGGQVIASASEYNTIVTNGMSKFKRDAYNANSAILVNVETKDFKSSHPLAGIQMQRFLEKSAFKTNYFAPVQNTKDFLENKLSKSFVIQPSYEPGVFSDKLENYLPKFISDNLKYGILKFENKITGFIDKGILTGFETRSSSPVRIIRNELFQSTNTEGLYPAGEGAGYAGGITSSAVDGIKIAEQIIKTYSNSIKGGCL
ncbi:MAG: NAD(P)/FAD-dependent oxidoreductase [Thermotogota bacterium]